jgi:hypothetical protein
VKFDHLGQLTTAVRRRCTKCASALPSDPVSETENETKVVVTKGEVMDEKHSNKFRLGMLLSEVLDLDLDHSSPEALYAALEAQGCRWSGGLWFVLQGYRYEMSVLEGKGYYAMIHDPQETVVHSTAPCGDEEKLARQEAQAMVEWFEAAAFKASSSLAGFYHA